MEQKQTAVEWLATYIKAYTNLNWDEVIDQAKQMEKEQMIDAWVNGCDNGYDKAFNNITWEEMDSAKDNYYNETFGGNNE